MRCVTPAENKWKQLKISMHTSQKFNGPAICSVVQESLLQCLTDATKHVQISKYGFCFFSHRIPPFRACIVRPSHTTSKVAHPDYIEDGALHNPGVVQQSGSTCRITEQTTRGNRTCRPGAIGKDAGVTACSDRQSESAMKRIQFHSVALRPPQQKSL